MQAGPDLSIEFNTAEGLEVGKTQLKLQGRERRQVDRLHVDQARWWCRRNCPRTAADLAREGTNFWVVRPRLDVSGVLGRAPVCPARLYRRGRCRGKDSASKATSCTVGLETPPAVTHDRAGKAFQGSGPDLGLAGHRIAGVFSPYQRGSRDRLCARQDRNAVNVEVFVDAPNDKFVTNGTRFLERQRRGFQRQRRRPESAHPIAGVDGGGGVGVRRSIARAMPTRRRRPIRTSNCSTEAAAKANPDGEVALIRMRFDQSIRGLAVAPCHRFLRHHAWQRHADHHGFRSRQQALLRAG